MILPDGQFHVEFHRPPADSMPVRNGLNSQLKRGQTEFYIRYSSSSSLVIQIVMRPPFLNPLFNPGKIPTAMRNVEARQNLRFFYEAVNGLSIEWYGTDIG